MKHLALALLLLLLASGSVFADPYYGVNFSYPIITKDPQYLAGYRGALWYQPSLLIWDKVSLYFDASFAHWHVISSVFPNRNVDIYTASPIMRYYLSIDAYFSTYAEASIGAAYMTHTRLDDRNLGMHFAFQDMISLGALVGKERRFSVAVNILHYSNASFCKKNAGITIPLMVSVGYGFG